VQHVVLFEVGESDPPAVERAGRERLAVQLYALDRRADELDEGAGAGLTAAEFDVGFRCERLVAAGEVQPDLVTRFRQERGARPGFLTGEIVPSRYKSTLSGFDQAQDSALPGRK